MPPLIHCKNLSFSYGELPLLSDVCCTVAEKEFVAFIGPNGSGKTTLLNLIMGFLKPRQGTITLAERLRLGYVPQSPQFDRSFPVSVIEIVEMGLAEEYRPLIGISREGKVRAMEALERVGMNSFAHHRFGELSGGQAQKVLIARAIASAPHVLLLDEPTANVDAEAEQAIIHLLHSLKQDTTILMVTHDFHTITQYVDRVLLFQKTVVSLAPEELCNHYAMGVYHPPHKGRPHG